MGNGGIWSTYGLFAALAAVPAILSNWRPWEIVGLVAILAPAGALAAWAWAWHAVQARRVELAELTALSSDEQTARSLGRSLGRLGSHLSDKHAQEIADVFAEAPSETKRAMALAVAGLLAETDSDALDEAAGKVRALACGFRDPAASALTTDEQVARAFGEALGKCSEALDGDSARELGALFAALPVGAKRGLANALVGYTDTAYLYGDDIGARLLALARAFRDGADVASPDLSPALTP